MSSLVIPVTHVAGTPAEAADVNVNNDAIVTWSTAIGADNITQLTTALNWNITTGSTAITITNSGDQGSIDITQSQALNPNRSSIKTLHTAAEISGDAGIFADFTNASSSKPAIRADHAGSGAAFQANSSGSGPGIEVNSTSTGDAVRIVNSTGNFFVFNDGVEDRLIFNNDEMKFLIGGTQILNLSRIGDNPGMQFGDENGPVLDRDGLGDVLGLQGRLQFTNPDDVIPGIGDGPVFTKITEEILQLYQSTDITKGGLQFGDGPILRRGDTANYLATDAHRFVLRKDTVDELQLSASNNSLGLVDDLENFIGLVTVSDINATNNFGLRIVRGAFDPAGAGTIIQGEGWTLVKVPATLGRWTITMIGTQFVTSPVVTLSKEGFNGNIFLNTDIVGTTTFEIQTRGGAGGLQDAGAPNRIHFIAAGRYV